MKMWSATTEGFSPPSEVAQLDCCRDGWPGAAGEPSEVVQPGKGRVRILEPSRRWVGKFLDERFGSLIQLHVLWSENLKILKWVGFIAGAPLPPHLLVLHSRNDN